MKYITMVHTLQIPVKESYASAPAAGSTAAVGEEIVLQVYGEVQTTTTAVEPENEIGTD